MTKLERTLIIQTYNSEYRTLNLFIKDLQKNWKESTFRCMDRQNERCRVLVSMMFTLDILSYRGYKQMQGNLNNKLNVAVWSK